MNFIYQNGLLIKNNNTVSKIMNRYILAIIPFLIISIVYNIYTGYNYSIFINIILTNLICIFIQYIINLIKKDYKIKDVFIKNNILVTAMMLSIFTINLDYLIVIIISIIVTIFKNILNINNKAILIGIILINIYKIYYLHIELPLNDIPYIPTYNDIIKYSSIKDYLLGINPYYLSSVLSIIMFIYLFSKKSIKFIIPISIILTYSFTMTTIGILNSLPLWYLVFNIITGNIVFTSIYIATDYINTPITSEGQLIYGMIIGLLLTIFRFIIPEIAIYSSVLITTIITGLIDKLSFKLKYNRKFYVLTITVLCIIIVITSIILGNML